MKQYSPLQRRLHYSHGRLQDQELFLEPQPFFQPVRIKPLPTAILKCCAVQDQRYIFVSIQGDGAKLLEELLFFIKKRCTLQDNDHLVDSISEMVSAVGIRQADLEKDPHSTSVGKSNDYLTKVDRLIEENLCEENFNGCDLAKRLCCCEMQLYRKLKKLTNLSTANYIRRYRLLKSLQMLQNRSYTVSDACYGVGFHSLEYFSRSFKKEFGICPNEYRSSIMFK